MSAKSQFKENYLDEVFTGDITNSEGTARHSKSTISKKQKEVLKQKIAARELENDIQRKHELSESNRNCVIFTGRALVEILRD